MDNKKVYKTLWAVYDSSTQEGRCLEIFESKEEALGWRDVNDKTAIIVAESYTKREWLKMELDSLPGLEGYYV